jgi:hypothetical protein
MRCGSRTRRSLHAPEDPIEVDGYLRQGTKALLAGEHATARAVFEALFPHIADGEIRALVFIDREHLVDHLVLTEIAIPDVAAGSANSTRIADVRRYGVQDMPAGPWSLGHSSIVTTQRCGRLSDQFVG